jgi:hypothetical protein
MKIWCEFNIILKKCYCAKGFITLVWYIIFGWSMICMKWIKHHVFIIQKLVPNKATLQTTIKCLALCVTSLEPYATCITSFDLQVNKNFQYILLPLINFLFMIKLKCVTLQLFQANDITNATLVTWFYEFNIGIHV